ncbi:unnamed protein product [Adineta ricciae]|uniref:Uncharacterized protein n=1 Tax=Adineta ricciae TaxID=249248 RepID=A0A814ZKT0_ADIRI|nr:unnamed protein product [Adineta ricciae]
MKLFLYFIFLHSLGECIQPYFPRQVTFLARENYDGKKNLFAIDEINQRAYQSWGKKSFDERRAYAMKDMPYMFPDPSQSKYYVQLTYFTPPPPPGCHYGIYALDGLGFSFNVFPDHWQKHLDSFEILNYVHFTSKMIHSNQSKENEDYWYSDEKCRLSSGEMVPCQEIYFRRGTEIPLRTTRVDYNIVALVQKTTAYEILSIGEPDEKYFDSIPKNWTESCEDAKFGISYDGNSSYLYPGKTVLVQVWLRTAPHKVNGNDTLRIQWTAHDDDKYITLTPKELVFNGENFSEKQTLTIKRHEGQAEAIFYPIFHGGGLEPVFTEKYSFTLFNELG